MEEEVLVTTIKMVPGATLRQRLLVRFSGVVGQTKALRIEGMDFFSPPNTRIFYVEFYLAFLVLASLIFCLE